MKAIEIKKFGGVEVLEYLDVAEPVLQHNSILIRVEASGVNFADTYMRKGVFPAPIQLPFILGIEGCGTVIAVSEEQNQALVGSRVVFYQRGGSYAEKILINMDNLDNFVAPIPAELPMEIAASLATGGLTAFLVAEKITAVNNSKKIALVHGASGAVGMILSQLLKLKNIEVIGIVSANSKENNAYCDYLINRKTQDVSSEVYKLSENGVDYIFNSSGGATLARDMDLLRPSGEMIWFGFGESNKTVGMEAALFTNFMKGYSFHTHVTSLYSREVRAAGIQKLAELFLERKLKLDVQSLPLARAVEAHQWIEDSTHTGKMVLKV